MDLTIKHPITGKTLFSHMELACRPRDKQYGKGRIPSTTLHRFMEFRVMFRRPINPTSVCRSREYNASLPNSAVNSFHIFDTPARGNDGCIAMDIARRGAEYDRDLITLAWRYGFSIGIANTFIHIDDRTVSVGMPQAYWYYKSYSGERYDDVFAKYPPFR